jgi:hypothetical protein
VAVACQDLRDEAARLEARAIERRQRGVARQLADELAQDRGLARSFGAFDDADGIAATENTPYEVERMLLRLVLDRNGHFRVLAERPLPEIGLLQVHVQRRIIPTPVVKTT